MQLTPISNRFIVNNVAKVQNNQFRQMQSISFKRIDIDDFDSFYNDDESDSFEKAEREERNRRAEERRRLCDAIENIRYTYSDDPEAFQRVSAPFREALNRLNGGSGSVSNNEPNFDYANSDTVIPMENLQRIPDDGMMTTRVWDYMNYIVNRGPGGEMDRATYFRVNGRTVLRNGDGIRCLKLNNNELPYDMRETGTYFLDLKWGKVYVYNAAGTAVSNVPESRYSDSRVSRLPERETVYGRINDTYSANINRADEMISQERRFRLDDLVPIDTYNKIRDAARNIKAKINQNGEDNYRDTVSYYKSQGRNVIDLPNGNGLLQLNQDEILPEMKIRGVDYYITLDTGRIYANDKNCKTYDLCDRDDLDYSFDEDDDGSDLDYLLVYGKGKVNIEDSFDQEKRYRLYEDMKCASVSDINYYFRSVEACKNNQAVLKQDTDGIYYMKLPKEKLPRLLSNGEDIYINLKDGSLHTENSEAFGGRPTDYRTVSDIASEMGNAQMADMIDNYKPMPKIAPPPFKIERIERELTSIDPVIKATALEDIISYINSDSFDPNFKDHLGRNIIHLSMLSKDEKIKNVIAKAIGKGVNINTPNMSGQTPLMQAIKNLITAKNDEEKEINLSNIKFILNQNPDIDAKDNNGQTAFHLACMSTSIGLLSMLLAKNPNVFAADLKGNRGAKFLKTEPMKQIYNEYINKV